MLHDPNEVALFPRLDDETLQNLAEYGQELRFDDGEVLFAEGDPTVFFYVVLEGQVRVTKRVGAEETVLTIHQPGEFTGEISMLSNKPAIATGRALEGCRALRIETSTLRELIAECSPLAETVLTAMVGRTREVDSRLRQQEKMAALGKLAAGLAHELNNPAAAGRRSAGQIRGAVQAQQERAATLYQHDFTPDQRALFGAVQQEAAQRAATAPRLDPLDQSDREEQLAAWLDDHGVAESWQVAPALATAGIDLDWLDSVADRLPAAAIADALAWVEASLTVNALIGEVEQSASRIADLVKAVKSYSHMDQAELQQIDVHEGIETTLKILAHKLKHGVEVVRKYDQEAPKICAYAGELNQVWTNLIDNAIDAMDGQGRLTLTTTHDRDHVVVEIADSGSGIPETIQSRIFEPFFTTKGVGAGSGLGLDIAYRIVVNRHHGDIKLTSTSGDTRFQVWLPVEL